MPMKLILQFDVDADLLEVPQSVVENRELLQKKFTTWIYKIPNKYWITARDSSGRKFRVLRYRGDAFVEWLNRSILTDEKARILQTAICDYPADLPVLYF